MSGAPLALLRLLSLRHFARHRLRTAIAVASVALGVAAFLGMVALNRGVLDSFARTARLRAAGADLMLRGGRAGIERGLAAEVAALPGVRAAVPLVARTIDVVEPMQVQMLLIGLDPETVPAGIGAVPQAAITQLASPLDFLKGGRAVFLSDRIAWNVNLEPGDEMKVATPRGIERVRLGGLIRAEGVFAADGGYVLGARLDDAIALTSSSPYVDRVNVFLEPGAALADVRARIDALLRGRAETVDPAELAREYDATLGSFRIALRFLSLLSLLIAAFLVHSTLSMALAERRRELAIARCVGLSAARLRALLVVEGLVLGGLGAVAGVPLGWLLARVMAGLFWQTVGNTFDRIEVAIAPPTVAQTLLGVACGLAAAAIAVAPPAFAAARVPPLEGLTIARTEERASAPRPLRLLLAALCLALAVAGFLGEGFGIEHAGYGVAVLLVAAIALGAHPLLALVLRGTGPAMLRWLGPAGRLARDHCERAVGPTSLTVVAIALGFGLVYSTDVLVKSYVQMLHRWFDANLGEDLLVQGPEFLSSGLQGTSVEVALRDELAAIPGVLHAGGMRFSRIPYERERILLFAMDGDAPLQAGRTLYVEGSEADREGFARGEGVFVSHGFARRFGRSRGSTIELPTPAGRLPVRVLAVVEDYMWPRGSVWIDDDLYRREFHDDQVQQIAITLDGTRPLADVRADVERIVGSRFAALVLDAETIERDVMNVVEDYWTLLFAQEGLAVLVAFLGTLHTLLISALLRRREIALLRALGAPLRTIGAMLRTEGVLLGLAGGAIGILFGLAAAAIALRMLSLEEQGFAVALRPSIGMAALTLLAAGFTGWLAGVLPGRRAARGAPREALLGTIA